jgi:hypothetical protein
MLAPAAFPMNIPNVSLRRLAFLFVTLVVSAAKAELVTGMTTTNLLVSFDSATPGSLLTSVGVTGLQAGESLLGLDRRPATGLLYGLGSTSRLYTINTSTGVATQVGSAGAFTLNGTAFGTDFNPVVDRLRVDSNTGQNLRLNPNDGALAATDTALSFAAGDPNAGATARIVGAAYTNNVAAAASTSLFTIDSNLDLLALQGSPGGSPTSPNTGQLFTVGALGFNTSDLVGFDISGASGIAFASLTAPAANASQLFTINLTTGAATLVGTIGGGVPLTSLAVSGSFPSGVPDSGATFLLFGVAASALWVTRRFNSDPRGSVR